MNHAPTHLDLFSGIGGFALAAQWAGFKTIAFVERELFCQKVLAKHWPDVPIYSDICQFSGRSLRPVSLLTGGFPCQPFSVAGEQRGKEDDRYLWPEMLRVIQATNPDWIIGENVAGLDGLGLDDCISDLEANGYEVAPPLEIPACAVGANHRRNRIWVVANSNRFGCERGRQNENEERQSDSREAIEGLYSPEVWTQIPKPYPYGMDDGIPSRVDRILSAGNSIVPQVAYQITKAIYAEIQKHSKNTRIL